MLQVQFCVTKLARTGFVQANAAVAASKQCSTTSFAPGIDKPEPLNRVIKEAFYLARTGRPGPVLVDVPKDIQQQLAVPDWSIPMAISGYMSRLPQPPQERELKKVVDALHGVSQAA